MESPYDSDVNEGMQDLVEQGLAIVCRKPGSRAE